MAAKAIINRLTKKLIYFTAKDTWFRHNDAYFAKLDDQPVTVEHDVDGDFIKYINNDGSIGDPASPGKRFPFLRSWKTEMMSWKKVMKSIFVVGTSMKLHLIHFFRPTNATFIAKCYP